jgi:hypothetical protein
VDRAILKADSFFGFSTGSGQKMMIDGQALQILQIDLDPRRVAQMMKRGTITPATPVTPLSLDECKAEAGSG